MLSRIGEALYGMGRDIERALNVVRILEVSHKMGLMRQQLESPATWTALYHAFGVPMEEPSEEELYQRLVLDDDNPFSVRRCIASARDRGRSLRDHISEEMWAHLNRNYLALRDLSFAAILREGRSDFNLRIETFCDAFHGIADDTMLHGDEWRFLRMGKYVERVEMIARILEIQCKRLSLEQAFAGRPIDFHRWQGMLRSLSAYEPYRRCYDARIVPARALDFVLRNRDFPRSLAHCLDRLDRLVPAGADSPLRRELGGEIGSFLVAVERLRAEELLEGPIEGLSALAAELMARARQLAAELERASFRNLYRVPPPVRAGGALHVQVSQ